MPSESLIQQRDQTDNPAVKRGVVNMNATFSHHFFEIAQTQGISKIPANTLRDDIGGIVQAFEGISSKRHSQVTLKKTACYLTQP